MRVSCRKEGRKEASEQQASTKFGLTENYLVCKKIWVTQQGKIVNGIAIKQITAFSKIRIITRTHNSYVSINGLSDQARRKIKKSHGVTEFKQYFLLF